MIPKHSLFLLLPVFPIAGCFLQPTDVEQCDATNYLPPTSRPPALHVDGRYFKDSAGRVILLRGLNAPGDAKVPPFTTLTDTTLLDPLPAWGVNVLRLLFTWEAFEPDRCRYDDSYLTYYEGVVEAAAAKDLYIIVDFHQDAFSRFSVSGCGEGFPSWAVTSAVPLAVPDNDASCANWGVMMTLDPAHHLAWSYFHADRELARTRFLAMLAAVADRLASHPNVIGYDIINEPWGTDRELLSLYEDAAKAIRDRHPEAILFVAPHALASDFAPNYMQRPSFGNFAYAPHYYTSILALLSGPENENPDPRLNEHLSKASGWNVPLLLGEFGGEPQNPFVAENIEAIYAWLDREFVAGVQWCYTPGWTDDRKDGWNAEDFSIVDNQGHLRANFRPRPYPQKTAGTPLEFSRSTNRLAYHWVNEPDLGTTDIFVPEGYLVGKRLTLTTPSGSEGLCDQTGLIIQCDVPEAGEVVVVISDQ